MKKWISMFLLCTLLGALTDCGSNAAKETEKEPSQTDASGQEAEDTKEPGAEAAEPEVKMLDGLHIGDSASSDPDSAVEEWLEGLRF